MASDAKRRRNGTAVDRISSLPRKVIDHILLCLPMCDAARTSILSRRWRNMWGRLPQLVFNDEFFENVLPKYYHLKEPPLSEVSKTITSILFAHSGPILRFHLSIPDSVPLFECRDMYMWIKYLSNNGVRELEIFNKALGFYYNYTISHMFGFGRYNVPSYMFSCPELTHLKLTQCVLNPPLGFGGFHNLISVQLEGVTIDGDMTFGAQLKELDVERCGGIEHLGCQFERNNNLTRLVIKNCGEIDLRWFECTHKVQVLGLSIEDENYSYVINGEVINFDKLVDNMPEICVLRIDKFFLQLLEPVAANSWKLTTAMEKLNTLHLYEIEFCNLHQIQYVLCLIQSSPILQDLYITMDRGKNMWKKKIVVQYLLSPDLSRILAGQLETVRIVGMKGSKAELQFVKLLLASTPLLRLMKLEHTLNDPEKELRILQELLEFPRASTAARVMWRYRKMSPARAGSTSKEPISKFFLRIMNEPSC